MFTLLASEVQPEDIQAATKLAGKKGAAKVLKKILTEHSPSQDTVSQALKMTAKEYTKTWNLPILDTKKMPPQIRAKREEIYGLVCTLRECSRGCGCR